MTTVDEEATAVAEEVAPAIAEPEVAQPPSRGQRGVGWPVVILGAALGTVVIGVSYRLSAQAYPADVYYLVFWAGMLTATLPVAARLIAAGTARGGRLWAVPVFGVVTAIPKLLRNFTEPRYHDEYAHWREAIDVMRTGHLFNPNATIPIVEFYPGTSALTAASHSFTGLSMWSSGVLVVLATHVLGLFGVYMLGETLLSSAQAGGVAAAVYGINPSAIYFDTQYAYESVAINFFLWTLALAALSAQSDSVRQRYAFLAAAVLTAADCVVTHHLTAIMLMVTLTVVALTATLRDFVFGQRGASGRDRDGGAQQRLWVWWVVLAATIGLAVAWVTWFARPTLDYLSPYFGNSLRQLGSMAQHRGQGGRHVLAANVEPIWEQFLTGAAPLAIMVVVVAAAVLVRKERFWLASPTWGLMVFGLGYFVSIPFILAPSGAEGARRSWGFTYVGVALIVALAAARWPPQRPRWLSPRLQSALTLALLVVVLIGNVGGGLNDPYRFPGPFRWGTDTNSASDEARTVARELAEKAGTVRVVADAYTALQLAAYGGLDVAAPSPGFPVWNLTQTGEDPSPALVRMLVSSRYDYLVVDIRMAEQAPFNGHNFGQGDPLLGRATPMPYLTRLDTVPWATRVISTEHLRVYRLNLLDIATRPQPAP